MPDIYLYPGATNPHDIILRDPTQPAAGGGHIVAIGQATETDFAQSVIWAPKMRLAVLATETDLAQPAKVRKTKATTQATETDLAQAATIRKTKATAQATEADLAQPVTHRKTRATTQATETDQALAATHHKFVTVGVAIENDIAQAVTWLNPLTIGMATETDQALMVSALMGAEFPSLLVGYAFDDLVGADVIDSMLGQVTGRQAPGQNAAPLGDGMVRRQTGGVVVKG